MIPVRLPCRRGLIRAVPLLAFLLGGCTWTVTPPPPPDEPRTVRITVYGKHSRVAIQTGEDIMTEYGYGDWRFYAEGDKILWSGLAAIFHPTPAALGKRDIPLIRDTRGFNARTGADRSVEILCERSRADSLRRQIEEPYRRQAGAELRSSDTGFTYVTDDRPYHLFHNSNHRTAAWLEALGCEIAGNPIYSNFRVIGADGKRRAPPAGRFPVP